MVCSLALWLLTGASCSPRGRPSGLWEDELPTEPGFVSCKNIFLSCKKKKKNKTCRLRAQVEPEENRKKKTLRESSRENKVVSHDQLLLWMRAAAVFDLLDL